MPTCSCFEPISPARPLMRHNPMCHDPCYCRTYSIVSGPLSQKFPIGWETLDLGMCESLKGFPLSACLANDMCCRLADETLL
jgi:hypothetical protein